MINSELVFLTKAIELQDIIDVIEYNIKIGFEKITIFDNESYIDLSILKNYKNVTVIPITGFPFQTKLYTEFCKRNVNESNWICLQDDDEMLYIKNHNNVNTFLNDYNNFSGVSINLKEVSTKEAIITRDRSKHWHDIAIGLNPLQEVRRHVTTIVKPKKILCWPTPHVPLFIDGYSVLPDFKKCTGPCGNEICEDASFYHYALKDYEYHIKKTNRGCADDGRHRYLETIKEYKDRIKKTYTVDDYLMKEKHEEIQ